MSSAHPPVHPPPPRRSDAEQTRIDAALHDLFQNRILFNRVLGLTLLSVRHGDVHGRFDMKPDLIGHPASGRLHGGVTAAVLDAIGGLAGMAAIAEHHAHEGLEQVMQRFARFGTIDLRVDYLRPGIGRHFVATTEVTRLGGRVASTLMRLHNDAGVLIATAAAAYSVS
ncbi:MAG TPA: thioesterase family protein [Rubrivivax sp.]|nr:thioesterase family protein [Burkholderiales bacterium]HNT39432.1 thioesterase family protein [Rubrivivax sp.]